MCDLRLLISYSSRSIPSEEPTKNCSITGWESCAAGPTLAFFESVGTILQPKNVWFSESNNPKRKLKYTLEIIDVNKKLVGINTQLSNKIVFDY